MPRPLSIILDMRRYLVMEQSAAPQELAIAMTNIENNGAPWPYNQMDRLNWAEENGQTSGREVGQSSEI